MKFQDLDKVLQDKNLAELERLIYSLTGKNNAESEQAPTSSPFTFDSGERSERLTSGQFDRT